MTNVAKIRPDAETEADPLAKLREPFPDHQVSKLPKPTKQQTDAVKDNFKAGVRCKVCGSWHHPDVVHLDYVGHAALTDRLLDTDTHWSWEPVAFRDGLPAFDSTGGLWIKLTVCGVTRLGYGHAAAKPNQDPGAREKEVIGDALRNAAMRFGAALDLWHKGDLHRPDDGGDDDTPTQNAVDMAINLLRGSTDAAWFKEAWSKNFEGWKKVMSDDDYKRVLTVKTEMVAKFVREAEEAKARERQAAPAPASAAAAVDPFDDEIPF